MGHARIPRATVRQLRNRFRSGLSRAAARARRAPAWSGRGSGRSEAPGPGWRRAWRCPRRTAKDQSSCSSRMGLPPPRVGRALGDAGGEDPASLLAQARASARGLGEGRMKRGATMGLRPVPARSEVRRDESRGQHRGARAGGVVLGGPGWRRAPRTVATRPPRAASPSTSAEKHRPPRPDVFGGKKPEGKPPGRPGQGGRDEGERQERQPRPESRQGEPSPGGPPVRGQGLEAQCRQEGHRGVHGEEGLRGKAEGPEQRDQLDGGRGPPIVRGRPRARPGGQGHAPSEASAEAHSHGRQGQRRGAQVEAQEVGKAPREEVRPPPASLTRSFGSP